jgi:Raf kinase inhibitor-like YbhB/YbcL family protein
MRVWPKLASLFVLFSLTSFAQQQQAQATKSNFTVTSSAFAPGAIIPPEFSCEGKDISPALQWTGAPARTAAFAIIMDDPDAPAGVWVHWVMWNLAPASHSLPEGVAKRDQLEDGSHQGRNSFGKVGYNGPCPPAGQTHRYFFRVYALDTKLTLSPDADRSQLDAAMQGHVVAHAEYMGTFHR